MAQEHERVERELLEAFAAERPGGTVVAAICRHLAPALPIRNMAALREAVERGGGLRVGDERLPVAELPEWAHDRLFPIENVRDLVRKVSAGVEMALLRQQRQGVAEGESALDRLTVAIAREASRDAAPPTGYFGGPSVFGGARQQRS